MFKYFVLNEEPAHSGEIGLFNIFDNWILDEAVQKEVRKYLRAPKKYKYHKWDTNTDIYGFEAFCMELNALIKWQEWSRIEYEIVVKTMFDKSGETERKIDCWFQTSLNISTIARDVIWQYKQAKKAEVDSK